MTAARSTPSALLAVWEEAEGARAGTRALALLAAATPDLEVAVREELTIGRRDQLLIAFRERLFGSRFTGITSCPACGQDIEVAFDADEVRSTATHQTEVTVVVRGHPLCLRLPTAADAAAVEHMHDVAAVRQALIGRCIRRVERADRVTSSESTSPDVLDEAIARLAALDPQSDVALALTCPGCAHDWREQFDIVSFLWTEVSAWARRLLADVHAIASVYGWSEEQILRLSPARRSAYLELLR